MTIENPKQIVASGYDQCADSYAAVRRGETVPELALLIEKLPASARILDVGCGAGIPVTAELSQVGSVVGVDISASQIRLARANVPAATFIHGDIMAQEFADAWYDAVVSFYALFHLPREEQPGLLAKLVGWLRPGGYLLATLAASDEPEYTEPNFFGATMYWSHYDASWYVDRLIGSGCQILHLGVVGHGYDEASSLPPERHPVVLARRGRLPNNSMQRTAPNAAADVSASPDVPSRRETRGVAQIQCGGQQV
jgi:SAM-dependent methyltransferase